jgi:hypothetical protein
MCWIQGEDSLVSSGRCFSAVYLTESVGKIKACADLFGHEFHGAFKPRNTHLFFAVAKVYSSHGFSRSSKRGVKLK